MRFINIWIIGISAFLFWGCDGLVEDLDESKLPKIESKLVVSCYISPQSPTISVIVSESQPLLGPSSYYQQYVTNAEVVISGESGQIRLPYRDSVHQYYVDSSAFKIVAGQTYTLSIKDGERSVKATCTVPTKSPEIKDVSIEKLPLGFLGDSILQLMVFWKDFSGEKNYYSIRGYLDHEITDLRPDPVTGEMKPTLQRNRFDLIFYPPINNLFNDANLDGATFISPEINLALPRRDTVVYRDKNNVEHSFYNGAKISEAHIEVMNMNEHYYKFLRSLDNYKEDNKFTEPTPVYTNIEGGLGCFAAFNSAVYVDRSGW